MAPNPTLEGEKLLIIMPWFPSEDKLARYKEQYPGLEIVHVPISSWKDKIDPQLWADATICLSFMIFPESKEQAPKLKYVQLSSAGCNHLRPSYLFGEPSVAICTANGIHGPQISEWVMMTFMNFNHHTFFYYDAMKENVWKDSPTDDDVEDLVGMRVGILGYGCIGRQCARLAKAFGMEVYAYTLRERATAEARRDDSYCVPGMGDPEGVLPDAWFSGATQEAIDEFVSQDLDLLVISLPLTDLTHNMIAAPQFKLMAKKKTFVSNVGRGPIVNTDDLCDALEAGVIRGAALDVTDPEPLPVGHKLWSAKNVFITPHTSGNSNHYNDRIVEILEKNFGKLAAGEDVVNQVDRKLGY